MVNEAGTLAIEHPQYVMRITGDSVEGKAELDNFIDPESRFPVIATTSELMTTGVDAKTCKLIVLDKTINSMTEFQADHRPRHPHRRGLQQVLLHHHGLQEGHALFPDPDFDGEPW